MSFSDTLAAKLECPETGQVVQQSIQIFFRDCYRDKSYNVGDLLDNLPPGYDNTWIQTDYVCQACSPKTERGGYSFVARDDQRRHICYIHVENSTITEVISEKEFDSRGIEDYVQDR